MDNKALELQSVETQTRAAAAVATKEHNLAMVSPSADRMTAGKAANTFYYLCKHKDGREEAAETPGRSRCNLLEPGGSTRPPE